MAVYKNAIKSNSKKRYLPRADDRGAGLLYCVNHRYSRVSTGFVAEYTAHKASLELMVLGSSRFQICKRTNQ